MAQASASSSNIPSDAYNHIPLGITGLTHNINMNMNITFPIMGAVPVPEEGPVQYSLAQLAEAADLSTDDESDLYFTDSSMSCENHLKRDTSFSADSVNEFDLKRISNQRLDLEDHKEERRDNTCTQMQGERKDYDQMNRERCRKDLENDAQGESEDKRDQVLCIDAQTNFSRLKKIVQENSIKNTVPCCKNSPLKRPTHEQNAGCRSTKKARLNTTSSRAP